MEVIIAETTAEVDRVAADLIAAVVAEKPSAVLGVATGTSPLGTYSELARRVREDGLDLSGASGFALDEYVGLPSDHPQSYRSVIRREVIDPLGMDQGRVHVPSGNAPDLDLACARYEEAIRAAGGIDIQILGIGANGHIGFNEPTSSLSSRTRVKTLAPSTLADNARFFDSIDRVPLHCVTQGLGTIMDARQIVLVAQGARKSAAIAAAVEGPVSSMCPASLLQHHRHVTVVVDRDAGARLTLLDYYLHVTRHKRKLATASDQRSGDSRSRGLQ